MDRPECQNLDRVLDAAVIVTWPDLITLGHSGSFTLNTIWGQRQYHVPEVFGTLSIPTLVRRSINGRFNSTTVIARSALQRLSIL
jgi:hypothetical protein